MGRRLPCKNRYGEGGQSIEKDRLLKRESESQYQMPCGKEATENLCNIILGNNFEGTSCNLTVCCNK